MNPLYDRDRCVVTVGFILLVALSLVRYLTPGGLWELLKIWINSGGIVIVH